MPFVEVSLLISQVAGESVAFKAADLPDLPTEKPTRHRMSEIYVLIVTSGNSALLSRTLQSIADSDLPENFAGVVVVDEKSSPQARHACESAQDRIAVRYEASSLGSKSESLNQSLTSIPTNALVVFSDDDIRFSPQTLKAYAVAAREARSGTFFGGPFVCDYESTPPRSVIPLLPVAVVGWTPQSHAFDPYRDSFLGFNWAAYSGDVQRLGGFDPALGPGSPTGAIGQDINMQRRMREAGMRAQFVEDALVHHYVPASRCSPEWAYQRARRNGLQYGTQRRERSVSDIALSHWKFTLQLFASTATRVLTSPIPASRFHIRARYRQQKALGYFKGFRVESGAASTQVA